MTMKKLIRLGWVDAQGRELSWRYWNSNPHRAPKLTNLKGKKKRG